jgi:hypothetical protein
MPSPHSPQWEGKQNTVTNQYCSGLILSMTLQSLCECGILKFFFYAIAISQDFMDFVSSFFLLCVIMVPICGKLLDVAKLASYSIRGYHIVYMTLLGILLLATHGINAHIVVVLNNGNSDNTDLNSSRHVYRTLKTICTVLAVVGMLIAAACMIVALSRSAKYWRRVSDSLPNRNLISHQ